MSSEVWYRKWRPQTFAEVHGQDHVVRTLANAVASDRVAHAYLLCGPRGTGKTTTARLLAKAVNCASPREGEPCNQCASCRAVAEGRALDLVEMDAASNRGIDDIRGLRDRVGYHPSEGRYRVYLIDEVHELTAQAFDALLKTLEEPPAHVIFVLATTDAHKVPATIISRCQRFDLSRIRHADIVNRLRFIAEHEDVAVEDGALDVVARSASGGLRDAVNLLEQLVASFGAPLTEAQARAGLGLVADGRARELAVLAAQGDFAAGLGLLGAVQDDGVEMRQFNREVVAELRAMLLVRAGADAGLEGLSADAVRELQAVAAPLDPRRLVRALKAFSTADFRGEQQPALPLELALAEVTILAIPAADEAERPAPVRPAPAARQVSTDSRPAPASAPSIPPAAPAAPAAPAVRAGSGAGPSIPPPVQIAARPATGTPEPRDAAGALVEPVSREPVSLVSENVLPPVPARRPAEPAHVTTEGGDDPIAAPAAAETPDSSRDHEESGSIQNEAAPDQRASAPAAPNGNGALTLDQARAQFRSIYERLHSAKETKPVAGFLNSGSDFIGFDNRTLTIGFRFAWMVERVLPGTAANKAIAAEVEKVLGRHYEIQSVHSPDCEDRLRASPPRASHLLDEAIKLGGVPLNRS